LDSSQLHMDDFVSDTPR